MHYTCAASLPVRCKHNPEHPGGTCPARPGVFRSEEDDLAHAATSPDVLGTMPEQWQHGLGKDHFFIGDDGDYTYSCVSCMDST